MNISNTDLDGVLIVEPEIHEDNRGFLIETFTLSKYKEEFGLELKFVQDNHSKSSKGVLRGLHYQIQHPQGKLVRCIWGAVYDVIVDIRKGSSSFGKWIDVTLSSENKKQVWIPPGLAHGFLVTSEYADLVYKFTDYYHPEDQGCLLWNDPEVGIDWPIKNPILSERDQSNPLLEGIEKHLQPRFQADS